MTAAELMTQIRSDFPNVGHVTLVLNGANTLVAPGDTPTIAAGTYDIMAYSGMGSKQYLGTVIA